MKKSKGLYIVMISVHGLFRSGELELGRDPDTGGQIRYVLDLIRHLSKISAVDRVDLITRQIIDPDVSSDYAVPEEPLSKKSSIIRLPCGPKKYLRKEVLWPYLDIFSDEALKHIRRRRRVPDFLHSHYADAGYVGSRLASLLGIPLVHTAHSLGRTKRQRFIKQGARPEVIDKRYYLPRRIEAEEQTMDTAELIITSTHQEIEEQYRPYDNYHPSGMVVIPPGFEQNRFQGKKVKLKKSRFFQEVSRFLMEPKKPMILAMARPDARKNLGALVRSFGESEELKKKGNLVLVMGQRQELSMLETESKKVVKEILSLIDHYDLYGKVAYPKSPGTPDPAEIYGVAAATRGVFVNPAFIEPFGLTLIEAAACGLPVVATHQGGPPEIIEKCRHGLLIDPMKEEEIASAILSVIREKKKWFQRSESGKRRATKYFSWDSHVTSYLKTVTRRVLRSNKTSLLLNRSRLPEINRAILCDIDNTLIGDRKGLNQFVKKLKKERRHIAFGVATGRDLDSTMRVLKEWSVPMPDILITSVGSEIHYGPRMVEDDLWARHISYRWTPEKIYKISRRIKGLNLQPPENQRKFKVSYFLDPKKGPKLSEIRKVLRQNDVHVHLVYSHQQFLDVLPIRTSKGAALRHIALKWDIPLEQILVAGDSGNDAEMLCGETLGVVVGNYSPELESLRGLENVYFANGSNAWGVLEALEHYHFLDQNK